MPMVSLLPQSLMSLYVIDEVEELSVSNMSDQGNLELSGFPLICRFTNPRYDSNNKTNESQSFTSNPQEG